MPQKYYRQISLLGAQFAGFLSILSICYFLIMLLLSLGDFKMDDVLKATTALIAGLAAGYAAISNKHLVRAIDQGLSTSLVDAGVNTLLGILGCGLFFIRITSYTHNGIPFSSPILIFDFPLPVILIVASITLVVLASRWSYYLATRPKV